MFQIKLEKASVWFSLVLLCVLGANAYVLLQTRNAYDGVVEAQLHQRQATELTSQLRRETEQLESLVRAYTVTGESRYLLCYYDIIAIRQGEKAAPVGFNPDTYWDEVIAGRIQNRSLDVKKSPSLAERMKALGFSAQELAAYQTAMDAVQAMNQVEQIAFAATQGLYDPAKSDFVSDGEPNLGFASELVHGQKYSLMRADLSAAIAKLTVLVDNRTVAEATVASDKLRRLILQSLAVLFATFVWVVIGNQLIYRYVLTPLKGLSDTARRLAAGDYGARTERLRGVNELVALGGVLDGMAASIEDDIQMRSIIQDELEVARLRAEDATHAKSMFLANMSHEIRTPMNAIIGLAYLALETELTPRQYDYIDKVHSSAKTLLAILNDILDFSKIEAGKIELDQIRFDIEDVLGASLALLRQQAQDKDIELLLDMTDPSLLADAQSLLGDPLRLGQVLTNLLSNAVKFTHQGHVCLAVALARRDAEVLMLRFSVRDTGIGMTDEQMQQLFVEFVQADGSTTRKYGGTGLGLTISKRFVELMGGQLHVESAAGRGSIFSFSVPFPMASAAASDAPVLAEIELRQVLVVDDHAEARRVLIGQLAALGVGAAYGRSAVGAVSCREALDMIRQARESGQGFDLMLINGLMPELDDRSLQDALQAETAASGMAVAVCAYDYDFVSLVAERLDAQYFLPKPVLPDVLRNLFGAWMRDSSIERRCDDRRVEARRLGPRRDEKRAVRLIRPSDTRLQGMRVLLVEDNRINQQVAAELMNRRGVRVDIAGNGQEALEQLERMAPRHYHAVLMDLQMPVMDGYEATRLLRANPRYGDLPVIAMTAHALPEEQERCRALGMAGHVSKPIDPQDLYDSLLRFYKPPASAGEVATSAAEPAKTAVDLPALAGLDGQMGLARCDGDPVLYQSILASFAADYAGFGKTFPALLARNDWPAALRQVHTLKGLAGTIGATTLQTLAADLERACNGRASDAAKQALTALLGVLQPLVTGLLRDVEPAAASGLADAAYQPTNTLPDRASVLADLRQLLLTGDADAVELWATRAREFSAVLSPQAMQRLGKAINNFEFDAALVQLDKLAIG